MTRIRDNQIAINAAGSLIGGIALVFVLKIIQSILEIQTISINWAIFICAILASSASLLSHVITKKTISKKMSSKDLAYDKVYHPADSVDFYRMISEQYDDRNKDEIKDTHRAVILAIEQKLENASSVNLLDIGGGSGNLIADHFFHNRRITWNYTDACGRMADLFSINLHHAPLKKHITVIPIEDIQESYTNSSFDIIVLSFVMSSMPRDPDFAKLSKLLVPGGIVIVAEADPAYSGPNPYYDFTVNRQKIALKIRPVHNLYIEKAFTGVGLQRIQSDPIPKGELTYSYVTVFQKPLEMHENQSIPPAMA